MIAHKCSPYCEPDDGVHCVPALGNSMDCHTYPSLFQRAFSPCQVIKIKPELDVTQKLFEESRGIPSCDDYGRTDYFYGFLVWLRDKDSPCKP